MPLDRPIRASAACLGLHAELARFELLHQASLGHLHQLAVDAYGGQHAGPPTGARYLAYSVAGLALAIEHGWSGVQIRVLHARMGPVQRGWPELRPPSQPAGVTAADVVAAGARADSVDGHAEAVERWAQAVWRIREPQHPEILRWVAGLVADGDSAQPRSSQPGRRRG